MKTTALDLLNGRAPRHEQRLFDLVNEVNPKLASLLASMAEEHGGMREAIEATAGQLVQAISKHDNWLNQSAIYTRVRVAALKGTRHWAIVTLTPDKEFEDLFENKVFIDRENRNSVYVNVFFNWPNFDEDEAMVMVVTEPTFHPSYRTDDQRPPLPEEPDFLDDCSLRRIALFAVNRAMSAANDSSPPASSAIN